MKKNTLIIFGIILFLALVGAIVKVKFLNRPGLAAISINASPKATVFIDGIQVGITPYSDNKIKAGEHTVKLVPEVNENQIISWEGKVNLIPNIMTVINRTLGQNESSSSGEIIWLEKIASKDKSALMVVSFPDQAVVKIDGEPKGFAPVSVEDLLPGNYQVTVSSLGYEERSIPAKTIAGYKLVLNIQLSQKIEDIVEATSSGGEREATSTPTGVKATPTPKIVSKITPTTTVAPLEKPYVVIKETPTGWLRVRTGPSTSATEAAKVKPGEMFPYLEEEENGWYKIEYEKDKEGWIKGEYAELVE